MASFPRPTTVLVKFDRPGVVLGSEIFEALASKDYNACSVQRSDESTYLCSFASSKIKEELLRLGSIKANDMTLFFNDADHKFSFVTVFNAPYELENYIIEKNLEKYGRIISSRYGHIPGHPEVQNGLRHFRMVLSSNIPNWIYIGKFSLMIRYDGQEKTCRRCDAVDHLANACNQRRCFNCGKIGHISSGCEDVLRCAVCRAASHLTSECRGWVPVRENAQPVTTQPENAPSPARSSSTPLPALPAPLLSVTAPPTPLPSLPSSFNFSGPTPTVTPRFNLFSNAKASSAPSEKLKDMADYLARVNKVANPKKKSEKTPCTSQPSDDESDSISIVEETQPAEYDSDASFFSTGSKRSYKSSDTETVKSLKSKKSIRRKKTKTPWK